jgi:cobalt-precorrin 5A hydrolase/precorrin-3B C17-methyltransferase
MLVRGRSTKGVFWIGIGCQKNTAKELIKLGIWQTCARFNLALESIAGLATIDRKRKELGIVEFCRDRDLPLKTFSAELLATVKVPNPSWLVGQKLNTPSVAEAAALLAISEKDKILLVNKQIIKNNYYFGSVTIAIASRMRPRRIHFQ